MAENNVSVNEIINVLKAAGVDIDRDFAIAFSRGFASAACGNTANKALEDMDVITRAGINAGYTRDMKRALADLMEVIADAAKERRKGVSVKEERELEAKRAEIMSGLKLPSLVSANEAKKLTLQYIDVALRAIPRIKNEYPHLGEHLDASEKVLSELRQQVESVRDGTTANALAKADEINTILRDWRKNASGAVLTHEDVVMLEDARAIADEWARLCESLSSRNKVKPDDRRLIYIVDLIDNDTTAGRNRLESLKASLSVYQDKLEKRFEMEELEGEIAYIAEKRGEKEGEMRQLKRDWQNGRIPRSESVTVLTKRDRLTKEIDRLKDRENKLYARKDKRAESLTKAQEVIDLVNEYIIWPLETALEDNPELFRSLTEGPSPALRAAMEREGLKIEPINFAAVMDLAKGVFNGEELARIMIQIKNIIIGYNIGDKNLDTFIERVGGLAETSQKIKDDLDALKAIPANKNKSDELKQAAKDAADKLDQEWGIDDEEEEPVFEDEEGEKEFSFRNLNPGDL